MSGKRMLVWSQIFFLQKIPPLPTNPPVEGQVGEKGKGKVIHSIEVGGGGRRRGQWGFHCCQVVVLASHFKPGSESLEKMISLGDPKIRLHSTIWISRGSWEAILKNPLVKGSTVLSLVTTKESE